MLMHHSLILTWQSCVTRPRLLTLLRRLLLMTSSKCVGFGSHNEVKSRLVLLLEVGGLGGRDRLGLAHLAADIWTHGLSD